MKIALPAKNELGRWMTGGGILWAANIIKSRHSPDFIWLALATLGMVFGVVFIYLTIRANIYALIRRRQGREIARQ